MLILADQLATRRQPSSALDNGVLNPDVDPTEWIAAHLPTSAPNRYLWDRPDQLALLVAQTAAETADILADYAWASLPPVGRAHAPRRPAVFRAGEVPRVTSRECTS